MKKTWLLLALVLPLAGCETGARYILSTLAPEVAPFVGSWLDPDGGGAIAAIASVAGGDEVQFKQFVDGKLDQVANNVELISASTLAGSFGRQNRGENEFTFRIRKDTAFLAIQYGDSVLTWFAVKGE